MYDGYIQIEEAPGMYTNYTTRTRQVMTPVTEEVIHSFIVEVSVPVKMVQELVERNCSYRGYTKVGFNKIAAIKELRTLISSTDGHVRLGLRDAKEMIEEVYNAGIEAGEYQTVTANAGADSPDQALPV